MISFINQNYSIPYKLLKDYYDKALKNKQDYIEAILVSSYSRDSDMVDARFVNLKYVDGNEFIFFTNYNSPKAQQFKSHQQITAVIFWASINVQIRIKANIKLKDDLYNDDHFRSRKREKNALAVSSMQSEEIESYDKVIENYEKIVKNKKSLLRPEYWGGFSFEPYYFEFWQGHKNRINQRNVYELKDKNWKHKVIQP